MSERARARDGSLQCVCVCVCLRERKPLSSSELLLKLRVCSEEAGLCERATASFWAKSLQEKKERVKVSWRDGPERAEPRRGMKTHENIAGTETWSLEVE